MSCFSGDSKILTRNGYRDIKNLANEYGCHSPVIVWNGTKWIPAHFYRTNDEIKLYIVHFRYYRGCTDKANIVCTEYTNFKINNQLVNVLELEEQLEKNQSLPKIDVYLLPNKDLRGFIDLYTIDNATVDEIGVLDDYQESYGSDAESLIVNDILVY